MIVKNNEEKIYDFLLSLQSDLKRTYEDDKDSKFEYWRGFAHSAEAFYKTVEKFLESYNHNDSRE